MSSDHDLATPYDARYRRDLLEPYEYEVVDAIQNEPDDPPGPEDNEEEEEEYDYD